MASEFVDLPMTTSEQALTDLATSRLQALWPDWTGNDGDPEVRLLGALAPLAANAVQMAAQMPTAALASLGILFGIPYSPGMGAYTTVTFTFMDSNGYTVQAGSQINIDGFAFALADDLVCLPGSTSASGLVVCTVPTADANGLTGTILASLTLPVWVIGLSVLAPAAGGQDPDTDETYVAKVSTDRRLVSRAVVTLLDFELLALETPGVGRARANKDTSRNVTVTVTNTAGLALSAPLKAALLAQYALARMVNVTLTLADPTYNTVSVTYTAVRESGQDPVDLAARCNAALAQELGPLGFGAPQSGDPGSSSTTWIVDDHIYAWHLVAVLSAVVGVHRISALSINGGANGADLVLTGAVPLPTPGTFVGTIV